MTTIETDMLGQTESAAFQTREWTAPDEEFAQKIAGLVAGAPVAMLTTIAPDGSLRSRPMAALESPCENGEVWFFTADDSPKTAEIAAEHEVNLSYSEPDKGRYVSLSGVAAILRDPERARRAWNPSAQAWFPSGPEDPRLVLLRVRVHTAHEWDAEGGEMIEVRPGSPSQTGSSPATPRDGETETKMRLGR
jgi:general stress protein 26